MREPNVIFLFSCGNFSCFLKVAPFRNFDVYVCVLRWKRVGHHQHENSLLCVICQVILCYSNGQTELFLFYFSNLCESDVDMDEVLLLLCFFSSLRFVCLTCLTHKHNCARCLLSYTRPSNKYKIECAFFWCLNIESKNVTT